MFQKDAVCNGAEGANDAKGAKGAKHNKQARGFNMRCLILARPSLSLVSTSVRNIALTLGPTILSTCVLTRYFFNFRRVI